MAGDYATRYDREKLEALADGLFHAARYGRITEDVRYAVATLLRVLSATALRSP